MRCSVNNVRQAIATRREQATLSSSTTSSSSSSSSITTSSSRTTDISPADASETPSAELSASAHDASPFVLVRTCRHTRPSHGCLLPGQIQCHSDVATSLSACVRLSRCDALPLLCRTVSCSHGSWQWHEGKTTCVLRLSRDGCLVACQRWNTACLAVGPF